MKMSFINFIITTVIVVVVVIIIIIIIIVIVIAIIIIIIIITSTIANSHACHFCQGVHCFKRSRNLLRTVLLGTRQVPG